MRHPAKRIPIKSVRVSLADLRKIYERLLVLVDAEGSKAIAGITRPDNKSEEDFSIEMASLKAKAFRITVTIGGRDGESLFGDDVGVFSSPNIPEHISYIYLTNVVAFRGVANQNPINQFELNLDFSKPPLLDSSNFVSSPTPNNSSLSIEGDNDAWVSSTYEAVDGVLRHRANMRSLIHRGFAYDVGMFVFGMPFAFWLCSRLSPVISTIPGNENIVFSGAIYVYVVFVALFLYRIVFGYTKWAFPSVELADNEDNSGRHRLFWGAIVLAIFGNFAWEVIKAIG